MGNLVKSQKVSKYYENDCRFNGVYSRDNLLDKVKYGAYVINLDEYADIGTHWVVLYANSKTVNIFQRKSKKLLIIKT